MDQFNAEWLDQYSEEILEPELEICDAHHHLWHYGGYKYLSDDLLADINRGKGSIGHNVVSTVYMECLWSYDADAPEHLRSLGETRFVLAEQEKFKGRKTEIAKAMVGNVNLCDEQVGEALDAHMAINKSFRGIRHASGWHPSAEIPDTHMGAERGLLSDKQFRKGFAELGKRNLSFDAWLYHTNIIELAELADAFPDTQIVLDHCGGPLGIGPYAGKQKEVLDDWKKTIQELSKRENVSVKMGGMNMQINGFAWETNTLPPRSEQLAEATNPYYMHCIESFSVERCMWQSNFPVDKVSCSYDVLWNSFKRITKSFSESEKSWLFHNTAAKVYRF